MGMARGTCATESTAGVKSSLPPAKGPQGYVACGGSGELPPFSSDLGKPP